MDLRNGREALLKSEPRIDFGLGDRKCEKEKSQKRENRERHREYKCSASEE